jgi:hypothetical protein
MKKRKDIDGWGTFPKCGMDSLSLHLRPFELGFTINHSTLGALTLRKSLALARQLTLYISSGGNFGGNNA